MKEYIVLFATLFLLLAVIFYFNYRTAKRHREAFLKKIYDAFGKPLDGSENFISFEGFDSMYLRKKNEYSVDDITANDLEIDELFEKINYCVSAPGTQSLYYRLRNPFSTDEERNDFEKQVEFFMENEGKRKEMQALFARIGGMKRFSFFDVMDYLNGIENKNLFMDYLIIIVIFGSVGLMFVNVSLGIFVLICALCYGIVSYYKERGEIDSYVVCFSYIVNFLEISGEFKKLPDCFNKERDLILTCRDKAKSLYRFSGIVTGNRSATGTGNPLDIIMDYLKMIFHIDIIRFYSMLSALKSNDENIKTVYEVIGKVESAISVASMRKCYEGGWCIPEMSKDIVAENIYHPMISNPVKNDIKACKNVLLTGSNASGKSTFLKTIALNIILSETINTAFADRFAHNFPCVFSSMSLRDDLIGQESYFIVEIKSLKRITDFANEHKDKSVLLFIDEVLRGTNTVERIAACTEILKHINGKNMICFAATHDRELTSLLDDCYDNYHFDETIENDDVLFSYKLKEGSATTKNAIKLLAVMGFEEGIIEDAGKLAASFEQNGIWDKKLV